ncbi:MAG: glycosyltransferase family 2 protein [Prevotella sp.]|nr:glycosyltransferase family 2 protein [Prevotella sp.]
MKLSIVIPVYNVEQYIKRCIDSIISQETTGLDIECIFVDDCTPDMSMDIVKNLLDNYHGSMQFTLLKHDQNKGLSEARNTGIKNARGDSILFVDSDDYLTPNSISYMMAAKAQYPDADIVMGNVYEHRYKKNQYNIKETQYITGGTNVRRWMLTNEFAISAWNKIFNRQFLLDNNLFFEPGILYEDIPWTYKLYTKISSILLLPNVTYGYWFNEHSISSSSQPSDKAVRSFVTGCQTLLDIPYERDLYVQRSLFIFRWLLNGINARKNCSSPEILQKLYSQRSQFMSKTISDFRLILASFFLLMYQPFNKAFHLRFFRHHYNRLSKAVECCAQFFNFLHK